MRRETVAVFIAALALFIAVSFAFSPKTGSIERLYPHFSDNFGVIYRDGRALIDINSAGAELLSGLDGIGEGLAQRIIAYREENGPFRDMQELTKVNGIGALKLESLKARCACGFI